MALRVARRRYATASGAPSPPPGQPEVLRMLDKTIGNKWLLHIVLPLVVSLNGWAHLQAVIPADTYWLPAAYWGYSAVSLPLLLKSKPRHVWQTSFAIHVLNGFLYAQVLASIYAMRKQEEEKVLLHEGEEFEARFIKRQ